MEICFVTNFFDSTALCYKQTSPLVVSIYDFGCPKARENLAFAQFVHSALFFSTPQKRMYKNVQTVYSQKRLWQSFATAFLFVAIHTVDSVVCGNCTNEQLRKQLQAQTK